MRSYLPALLATAVFLAIGLALGVQLNKFLAISIADKALPDVTRPPAHQGARELALRMVDPGAVGIEPDAAIWGGDYLHHERRYLQALSSGPPFIDDAVFDAIVAQFRRYLDRMAGLGFNAVDMEGFLQFLDFTRVGDGDEVYPPDSVYRQRHAVYRQHFGRLFALAESRGFQVFLRTDMVALTGPLETYLARRFGSDFATTGPTDQDFWGVYQKALEELFERFPSVDGLMIRIGEAGAVYNLEGWDYRSELLVRTDEAVRLMLEAFLEVAERHDKRIIFRTWSVGVGQVGHMHTDPAVYHRVLDAVDSEHLIVSTKFVRGDFWSFLPLNPTLLSGRHKRIIEFQARREFETFNVVPNYVGPLHQLALRELTAANENIMGIWLWTQRGGPVRRGSMMLYPFHGMWLWNDANVHAMARAVADPARPIDDITEEWIRENLGDDPAVVRGLGEILRRSHDTLTRGLTVPTFARKAVRGMGLEIPPMMYCYWDIVATSTATASHLYYVSRDDVDGAIAQGLDAAVEAGEMKALLESLNGKFDRGKAWYEPMRGSLVYEENLLETLAQHKRFLLRFYDWIDRGGGEREERWRDAASDFERARDAHLAAYQGNLDFPAYNFQLADTGVKQAGRTTWAIWSARALLLMLLVLAWLLIRIVRSGSGSGSGSGSESGSGSGSESESESESESRPVESPALVLLLAALILGTLGAFISFSSLLVVMVFAIPGAVYLLGLRFAVLRGCPPRDLAIVLLPFLAFTGFVLAMMAVRGPFYFWYRFWTADDFRMAFAAIAVACLFGHVALVLCAMHRQGWRRAPLGELVGLIGGLFVMAGAVNLAIGFERCLTLLNNEMILLPGMTSLILGITTHLNIPTGIPVVLTGVGAALIASGVLWLVLVTQRQGDHPGRR